jgi:hypothetical protein
MISGVVHEAETTGILCFQVRHVGLEPTHLCDISAALYHLANGVYEIPESNWCALFGRQPSCH